jgi:hypothetical protein
MSALKGVDVLSDTARCAGLAGRNALATKQVHREVVVITAALPKGRPRSCRIV